MSLKEDCFNFRFVEMDDSGLGDRTKRAMSIPNCIINKMPMGGCPENANTMNPNFWFPKMCKMSQHLNKEIKGSKLLIIPDSENMVMVEKSKEFNEIAEEFIR